MPNVFQHRVLSPCAIAFALLALADFSWAQRPGTSQPHFPVTVTPVNDGLEVVTYRGPDQLLQRGDVISWVATPDSNNQVAVSTPADFETRAIANQDTEGNIALWVKRGNAQPEWVFLNLTNQRSADSADEASMLHVLYIHDPRAENDTFRWGCEFDIYRINSYLSGSIPLGMYSDHSFGTPTQDAEGLLRTIREYKDTISPNDSLLIYYSGHGSNDDRKGHMLDLRPGVKVPRTDVRKAMQDTGARLCLLITDCCASGSKVPFHEPVASAPLDYTSPYWNASICRALFFRHTGFVDVTSAGPGELAWSTGPIDENGKFIGKEPTDGEVFGNGGLLTTSLLEILAMHDGQLQELDMMDGQHRITWDSIRSNLQQRTEKRFQKSIYPGFRRQRDKDKHKHQTVTLVSTATATGDALPATCQSSAGIEFFEGPDGVIAGDVDRDRTPAWVGIKSGDKLLSVRRFTDSYYAHFWRDRKFTNGSQNNSSKTINGLAGFRQLITPEQPFSAPFISSGLWIFSVERNGVPTDISVRITEPSAFSR